MVVSWKSVPNLFHPRVLVFFAIVKRTQTGSYSLCNTFRAKALNLLLWFLTDEQPLKLCQWHLQHYFWGLFFFLYQQPLCVWREFKEWTRCPSLSTREVPVVVLFDPRHRLLLPAWAVVLQSASWVSGRPFKPETKERRRVFFLCQKRKITKASCCFCILSLLRVLSLPTN